MRAAIYERISMDRTGEQAGVTRQDEDCRKLADDLDWQVVEIYVDNDISATSGKPRPAYRRMLADIEAGRIDAVIAWHSDRLYRRMTDLEELADLCERHNLAVRTCRAGEIDMSTPTGRMLARILGAIAQGEVEMKADRWLRSHRQRREAGHWYNSANRTFGYERDGTIRRDEADALRHVVADILAGGTVHGGCRRLNDEGFATTRGNTWAPSSLRVTLRSPRIAGLSVLDGQIIGEGNWEPILDRDTWERVRAAVDTKNRKGPNPRRALLSGLAHCGVPGCGRRLYRGKGRGGPIYRCQSELQAFGHVAIAAGPLEEMVEAYARAKLVDDRVRRAVATRLSHADSTAVKLVADIDGLETEIRELEAALRQADGSRSKLALARSIDELDSRLSARRGTLATLAPVMLPAGDEWPDDLDRRSALIALVVARVIVHPARRRGGRFDPSRVGIDPLPEL